MLLFLTKSSKENFCGIGAHRQLGPSVSRVRSAKLDSWQIEDINILSAVGNKIANCYWENKMPKEFKILDMNSSMDEVKKFVYEKYVRKAFLSLDIKHPVQEYLDAVRSRKITPAEFYQSYCDR